MTYVEARDALVAHIHTAWLADHPTVPIYYEDTAAISLDSIPNGEFVTVMITFTDNLRQGIDAAPASRTWGEVTVRIFTKAGGGVRRPYSLFDYVTGLLKYRKLGGLNGLTLDCPVIGKKQNRDNWTSRDVTTDFEFFQ